MTLVEEKKPKYEKKTILGKGAYAKVYSGFDSNGQKLALKEFRKGGKLNTRLTKSAKNEVEIISKCEHKNIVKYIDSYTEAGKTILVMEYGSTTLQNIISEDWVSVPAFVRKCLKDIVSGLDYLHNTRKVIHLDLKPENILLFPTEVSDEQFNNAIDDVWIDGLERSSENSDELTEDLLDDLDYRSGQKMDELRYSAGTVKLCDFSISTKTKDQEFVEGCMAGTLWYRAPECLYNPDEGSVTPAVDIWALGCIVYEMCTGTPLFNKIDTEEGMLEKLEEFILNRSSYLDLVEGLDRELGVLTERMLDCNLETRITAKELLEELNRT